MHTWRFLGAAIAAGLVSSLTDWFFMGVLFHAKYLAYPEIWRRGQGEPGEARTNAIASLLNLLTAGGLIALCVHFQALDYGRALHLAFVVWLAVALPLLVANALYIKFHPLTVVAHSLGWLAKILMATICAVLILG